MKRIIVLAFVTALLTGCTGNRNKIPDGYELFFEDEFEGDKLSNNWSYEIGNGNNGWGNGEVEYYKEENAVVKDGALHIVAKREQVGDYQFTSARIKTANRVKFTYGIVEAKISLPAKRAMWPAFWMMPNDSVYGGWPHSGEIDIMEANGRSEYGTSCALHYSMSGHTYVTGYNNMNTREYRSSISEFHVYKCDWQEESISFYVDDRLIQEFPRRVWSTDSVNKDTNPNAPFDQDFYLLLNLAISGNYVNGDMPEADFTSAEMVVDYVRVYTYKGE
ncbi:MAG: family 16 glycosylhydrolase [Bacilli bacterium]|nr:family 16 glycosylhydrolase [Bacilli bacterium]